MVRENISDRKLYGKVIAEEGAKPTLVSVEKTLLNEGVEVKDDGSLEIK